MTKIGATWARVSSPGQTSLPDQVARAKEKLETQGYIVPEERILATDWTSPELFSCPDFQKLRQWVRAKEIQAIGLLDRDRLEAKGLERLIFLSDCKEAGVELVICQGPPLLNEPEGQLVELALAIGKERSVMRAKLGAKDGMADKVTRDRKPTSKHRVFGYRWVTDTRLEPGYPDYDTLKLIFDLVLTGATDFAIQKELKKAGKLSPKGSPEWDRSSISFIIHNPVYAGCYYALKRLVAKPKKRVGNSYGNSSARNVPLEQAVYLPEVEIMNPPITWEQREKILERRKQNQSLSKRNGHRDYLLRGFVFCETHRGKRGELRRYYGKPHYDTYLYTCPIGHCKYPNLNGPETEELAKFYVDMVINCQRDQFYELLSGQQNKHDLEQSLRNELDSLESKYKRNINAETELESRDLLGKENPEVYRRLKAKFQAERIWIEEREQAVSGELAQLDRQAEAIASLEEIRARFIDRTDRLTNAEWRQLFVALNLEIHVKTADDPEIWSDKLHGIFGKDSAASKVKVCFGVPLPAERVGEIMFNRPCPAKHNIYPIRLPLKDFSPASYPKNRRPLEGVEASER